MDSPESIVSSLDPEDNEVHFCKKCSKILEEGRAYELGGNRWHVECFRCSSCDSLLDGDTNLLVLGNGSLICANCSYHCYGCGKKIDDLAILTGDQAFCSSCFCCRNCKKKIEDLRYARTSQGIFCMTCHEALLAKKRKQKAARREREAREREALMNQTSHRDSVDSKHSDYGVSAPPLHRTGTDESLRSHRHSFRPSIQRNNSSFKDKDLPQLPPKDVTPPVSVSRDTTPVVETPPPNNHKEESRPPPKPRQDSLQNLHNLKNTTSHESMRRQSYIQEIPLGLGDLEESEKRLSAISNSTMPFLTPTSGGSDKDQSPQFEDAVSRSHVSHEPLVDSSSAVSTPPRHSHDMHTQKSRAPTESDKENQSPGEGDVEVDHEAETEGFISIGHDMKGKTEEVKEEEKEVVSEPSRETSSETVSSSVSAVNSTVSSSAASSPSPQRDEVESNLSTRSTDSGITVTPKVSPTKAAQNAQSGQPEEEERSRHRALSHALHGTLMPGQLPSGQPQFQGEVPERSHRRGQSPRPSGEQPRSSMDSGHSAVNKNLTPEPSKHAAGAGVAPFSPLSPRHDAHTNSANRSQQIVLDDDEEIDAALYANNNYDSPVPHTPQKRDRLGSSSSTHSRAGSVFHKNVGNATPGTPGRTAANAAPGNQSMVTPSRSSPWHRRTDSNGGNKDRLKTPDISLPILQASSAIDFDSELTGMISNPLSFNQGHHPQSPLQKTVTSPTSSLGHQRSVSDTHQSPRYAPSTDRRPSVSEEASVTTALRNELAAAQKRIVELERQLQSGPSQPVSSAADDDSTLSEKRKTIAVLHAQGEVARRELQSLKEAKGHDDPQAMIEEFTAQMAILKTQLQDEIASLSVTKEALSVEVEDLSRRKKEACEEMTILNVKNAQLTDLNNELTNNLIDKYHPTHGSAMMNTSNASKSAGGNLFGFKKDSSRSTPPVPSAAPAPREEGGLSHIGNLIVQAYQPDEYTNGPPGSSVERVPVTSGSASSSTSHLPVGGHTPAVTNLDDHEEPTVTVLEAGQVVDTKRDRQTARRFWKRPKAAVTKGAVKGFTKVFEQPHMASSTGEHPAVTNLEPSALSPSSSGQHEGAGLPHSASVNTGLNISFPSGKPTKTRNGWFKASSSGNSSSNAPSQAAIAQNAQGSAGSPPDGDTGSLLKVSITRRCQIEGNKVPAIVTKCIEEVERRGMLQEGIYRKSGARTQIEQIEARFEHYDERANYEEILSGDINGVASALKQYLRYLPDPLISASCYDAFIQVSSVHQDNKVRVDKMRDVLHKLPAAHSLCLARLCTHLNRVTQHAETNLMSNKNLAMVFAPTLARATSGEREIADMHHKSDSTLFMIEHFKELF